MIDFSELETVAEQHEYMFKQLTEIEKSLDRIAINRCLRPDVISPIETRHGF